MIKYVLPSRKPKLHAADHSLVEIKFIPHDEGEMMLHILVGEAPIEAVNSPIPVVIRKSLE